MRILNKIVKSFRNLKLRTKLIISYIFLIAPPTIITGYVYYDTSSSIILDNARQNIYDVLRKNNGIIDIKLTQIQESTNNLILDTQLYNLFSKHVPEDEYDLIQMDREVKDILGKYFAQYSDILTMHIITSYFQFGDSDFTFLKRDAFSKTKLYMEASNANGRVKWIPTYKVKKMFNMEDMDNIVFEYPYLFSAVKQLNITTVQPIGRLGNNSQFGIEMKSLDKEIERPVLIINFNEELFKSIYNDSVKYKDAYSYIISKEGDIIYYPDVSKVGTKAFPTWLQTAVKNRSGTMLIDENGKKMVVCYDTLNTNHWISAVIVPVESLLKTLPVIRYYSLYFGIGLTLLAIIAAFIVSGWMIKPLKRLMIAIKKMGEGNFDNRLMVPSNDEIGILVHNFNDMNEKIQRLVVENYETKIRENEAHIMALNLQLNPHFLANTLNIINWMAIENRQTEISKMIISLSSILEYTLRHNEEIVPFKDDFIWLKNYMFIMLNRFYGIFDVTYDIDPLLDEQRVPKLFMQTFVENSIIHGFETVRSGGIIKISGRVYGEVAIFNIEDNGKGMTQDAINKVIYSNGDRIGIKNIDKRIKLIYGAEYGVSISSRDGNGTKVTIMLPFKTLS